MNEEKKTKVECERVVRSILFPRFGTIGNDRLVDDLAAALGEAQGGFAPEVVRVPRVGSAECVYSCCGASEGKLFSTSARAPGEGKVSLAEVAAIAARSNALPGWIEGIRDAQEYLCPSPDGPAPYVGPAAQDQARRALARLLASMTSTEMGEGPEG